jgi:aspartyl-tRNA(Asn)/glutamyl-tRNA(Gln) amidotransferase subunit C
MSVDQATVRRIAHLARIAVSEAEVPHLQSEINAILAFVAELDAVDVEGVEDIVTDGEIEPAILANAPLSEDGFFLVPKVVE